MEYDLLKEIDAQYLIEYLQDLNTTILSWKDRLNYVHVEYQDLLEFDSDNDYAIDEKKEEFNSLSKEYYYEICRNNTCPICLYTLSRKAFGYAWRKDSHSACVRTG